VEEKMMIVFKVQKGNHKDGFNEVSITDANGMFELVELAQEDVEPKSRNITQWQSSKYTYINYGHATDFFRYIAVDLQTLKEKEED
jgi:hypothetical protein